MDISGKTKIVALLGNPVEHTLSPAMHNAAFEALGLDYCYVAFPVNPEMLGDAVTAVRALHLAGVNVTVPHKENVIPFLDEVVANPNPFIRNFFMGERGRRALAPLKNVAAIT